MSIINSNNEPNKECKYNDDMDTLRIRLPLRLALENQKIYEDKNMSVTESAIETLIKMCRGANYDKENR
tara:strand:- start:921 stop:1127 length:207 start_codon:yes stop_codon:yes gene_type:complete